MLRVLAAAAAVLVVLVASTPAADPTPAGTWKLTIPADRGREATFLIELAETGGQWAGTYLSSTLELPAPLKVTQLAVNGEAVRFTLTLADRELISFDGVLAKDGKKLAGSFGIPGQTPRLGELQPSKLKKLDDPFEVARENLAQMEPGQAFFDTAFEVLGQAAAKKMSADDARGLVDRVAKAAGGYGSRWERGVTLRLATTLAAQDGLAEVALAQARRAERMLADEDDAGTRMEVLDVLARTLTKAGKADDAKPYTAQVAKLEARDYADYAKANPPFKPEEFKGRKAKSDRVALVEAFVGTESGPSAAVELAFDGLAKTFTPSDAVLLQYHVHDPAPDPLASPDGMTRARLYRLRGVPQTIVNGQVSIDAAGTARDSEEVYKAFRRQVEEQLEKPAGAKLTLSAEKKGDEYAVKAVVDGLETPGEKMTLRFAVVEPRVRCGSATGLRYHHLVVRDMPGGLKGFPQLKKSNEQAVTIKLDELRSKLTKYLADVAEATEDGFARPDRPLALKNLKLAAFVQNDATGEVLQAAQIDLDVK